MKGNHLIWLTTKLITCSTTSRPAPTDFCYPGLSSKQFHSPNNFTFPKVFAENFKIIQNEFKKISEVYKVNHYLSNDKEHQLTQGALRWMFLWSHGHQNEDIKKLCPKTVKLLEGIPELMTNAPFGQIYFSCLGPNSSIKVHTGPTNIKLRCNLPIVVPDDGFLRVGGIFKEWKEGETVIFDECYPHEESNLDAKVERISLIFDIWHPELSKEERELLTKECNESIEKQKQKQKDTK